MFKKTVHVDKAKYQELKAQGLNQKEIAKALNVNTSYICRNKHKLDSVDGPYEI